MIVCSDGAIGGATSAVLSPLLLGAIDPTHACVTGQVRDYQRLLEAFGITALVGYDALVSDYHHYVGILERDPVQLQRFFAAKQSVDKWQNACSGDDLS
ncbi:hypothetical protein PQR68_29850 [Paraburkholderia agricolaris]|uniref:hypothetical protein n=1 Tax=Paraburkholderia agricolaris TaxID=2152888 RepID=UPI00129152FE|nr:hypothetical protein [Paraburkholderia agricolaris]